MLNDLIKRLDVKIHLSGNPAETQAVKKTASVKPHRDVNSSLGVLINTAHVVQDSYHSDAGPREYESAA